MKECTVCHFQNEDSSEFCKDCGSKLDQPPAAAPAAPAAPPAAPAEAAAAPAPAAAAVAGQTTCPKCQTANEPGDNFCKSCGYALTAPAPEAAPAVPAAPTAAPEVAPPAPPTPPVAPAIVTGPRLVITGDPGKGTAFALNKPQIKLGRAVERNDISLSGDGFVSGEHALITQEGNDFYIEDRGSTNGTYKLLQGKVKLQPGDVIKVGDTNLEFQV